MNALCYSPIFSLSQTLARFLLKPKDAIGWLVVQRECSASLYRRLLANCPEALLFGLCTSCEVTGHAQDKHDETSLDDLIALLGSPKKPSVDGATKIFDMEIDSSKRKLFLARLKKQKAESFDETLAKSFSAELLGLLDGTQLAGIDLPTFAVETWRVLASSIIDEEPIAFDLDVWLANESDYQKRLHEEKMASMKQLAYGASHEINNPLANIASRAQTLIMDETDPERKMRLAKINQQAFRAHEMIADMMLFAHPPQPEFAEFDLVAATNEVVDELKQLAEQQGTDVVREFALGSEFLVFADRTQISVALKALLMNSLEAVREAGRISIFLDKKGESFEVTIADEGPGISEGAARHLFDPFYSSREAGRGLGFGLSKVWRIAELHGGEILAESPSDGGARFRLRIPYRSSMKTSA